MEHEEQLLRQAEQGDSAAYTQLFEQHRARLRQAVALRLSPRLRQRIDESDIVQETFVETFQRLSDFLTRRPMPFALWLQQTARQHVLRAYRDHAQTAKRSFSREEVLVDNSSLLIAASLLGPRPTPEDVVSSAEYHELVHRAVSRLPDADREILLMRNVESYSYRDIAILLEIEEAAARKRYGRALLKLKHVLQDDGIRGPNDEA